jgi:cupin 2 domain-containing protein
MAIPPNLLTGISTTLMNELLEPLVESANCRIERIVSMGHASPEGFWYDQPWSEWVVLIQGAARVRFEDGIVDLKPGDHLTIPAHQKHRVDWTLPGEPTVWLAVHWPDA